MTVETLLVIGLAAGLVVVLGLLVLAAFGVWSRLVARIVIVGLGDVLRIQARVDPTTSKPIRQ